MHAPPNDTAPKGLRGWWTSPPRSGTRLIISPWEYRHLRAWARVRTASGIALAGLGVVTLSFGGNDWKTYGWTMAFLAAAAANSAFGLLGAEHRSLRSCPNLSLRRSARWRASRAGPQRWTRS
jgi:hypothetical protein